MEMRFSEPAMPESGTLVVFAGDQGPGGPIADLVDERLDGNLRKAVAAAGKRFKRGTLIDLAWPVGMPLERILVVGMGDPTELTAFEVEKLGAKIVVRLKDAAAREAWVAVEPPAGCPLGSQAFACHLGLGAVLRGHRFERYREREEAEPEPLRSMALMLDHARTAGEAFGAAQAVAAGAVHARDLVTEPANILTPRAFAEACEALASEVDLEVEILGPSELHDLGMRALLAVAQGSANDPSVAVMQWRGGEAGAPPVALVGKGVCFDSGGLSLKPASSMEDMKWDMGGAGAVFGAMKALAGRKARVNAVGVLGLVENMPSGTAQRPGDVIRTLKGLTVEVLNTDAEGRLVLADVLHYTAERFKPVAMVDLATLTGAVIVALGSEQAGLFTADDGLATALQDAGAAVGEKVWRLPLDDAYAEHVKSEIADIKNTGRAREAGATAGAMFLKRFVGDVPWAHLDIAGVTWSKRDLPLAGKGATGFGVRLLDRWIADCFET